MAGFPKNKGIKIILVATFILLAAFLINKYFFCCRIVTVVSKAPDLNLFWSETSFDNIRLLVNASDDEGLAYSEFYVDNVLVDYCSKVYFNKENISYCNWITSNETDNSQHQTYARIYDINGGWLQTEEITITAHNDKTPPELEDDDLYIYPTEKGSVEGTIISGTVEIGVKVHDGLSGTDKVVWEIKDKVIGNKSRFIWDTSGFSGEQNIKITAIDASGNSITNYYKVFIQNSGPQIQIIKPAPGEELSDWVYLEVNASSPAGIDHVTWYLEYGEGKTVEVGWGAKTFWGSGGLSGNYTISVNVTDKVGNTNNAKVTANFKSPDLYVLREDMIFTPEHPETGQEVELTFRIHNNGSKETGNDFYVQIFDSGAELNKTETNKLLPNETREFSYKWIPSFSGKHQIFVALDEYDLVPEPNEYNNIANKTLLVGNQTEYLILTNHSQYLIEKSKLKPEDNWRMFYIKWFEPQKWMNIEENNVKPYQPPQEIKINNTTWYNISLPYDIPREMYYEQYLFCEDMMKTQNPKRYSELINDSKGGRICPYDAIYRPNTTETKCPICNRTLTHQQICQTT